ncbi:MAG: hypothetical protein HYV26_07225 [Candidatus Hydrogenedentes bacterium]|nr:hypothetical protein [Candidatus Hydrogenedentota bacterium]
MGEIFQIANGGGDEKERTDDSAPIAVRILGPAWQKILRFAQNDCKLKISLYLFFRERKYSATVGS